MGKLLRSLFWLAAFFGAIAGILRLICFKTWTVPDDADLAASVAPSLFAGDTILLLTRGTPSFGELVRCTDPDNPLRFVVGRIAGVEGDDVEVRGAELTVNGKRYSSQSACRQKTYVVQHPSAGSDVEILCDMVEMGGGLHMRGSVSRPMMGTPVHTTVGEGAVFLLSDDREFPNDSRSFGTVPLASCSDRVVFRFWSREGWGDEDSRLTFVK